MEYAEKQTPPPAPIKFDYRAMTKEEERRFTKDFRGEGWEHGALTRPTRDDSWPKWAFDAAILQVLKTRTNPISYDDFLALAQSVPQPKPDGAVRGPGRPAVTTVIGAEEAL